MFHAPGMLEDRRPSAARASCTTSWGCMVRIVGISARPDRTTSSISVSVKPGQSASTSTPCSASSGPMDSAMTRFQAFDAA